MTFVPRIARFGLASLGVVSLGLLSLAGAGLTTSALAGEIAPGNGGSLTQPSLILPSVLPPSVQGSLLPMNDSSSFDMLGHKFGVQNGQLDFFNMRPDNSGDFKPLLRGGVGDGGLQLQLKW
jgi:hypothetical protein